MSVTSGVTDGCPFCFPRDFFQKGSLVVIASELLHYAFQHPTISSSSLLIRWLRFILPEFSLYGTVKKIADGHKRATLLRKRDESPWTNLGQLKWLPHKPDTKAQMCTCLFFFRIMEEPNWQSYREIFFKLKPYLIEEKYYILLL